MNELQYSASFLFIFLFNSLNEIKGHKVVCRIRNWEREFNGTVPDYFYPPCHAMKEWKRKERHKKKKFNYNHLDNCKFNEKNCCFHFAKKWRIFFLFCESWEETLIISALKLEMNWVSEFLSSFLLYFLKISAMCHENSFNSFVIFFHFSFSLFS